MYVFVLSALYTSSSVKFTSLPEDNVFVLQASFDLLWWKSSFVVLKSNLLDTMYFKIIEKQNEQIMSFFSFSKIVCF